MIELLGIAAVAMLFAAYGLLARRSGDARGRCHGCAGEDCGACTLKHEDQGKGESTDADFRIV